MSKRYCAFCFKILRLFSPKSKGAEQDLVCLDKKHCASLWRKQSHSVLQASIETKTSNFDSQEKSAFPKVLKTIITDKQEGTSFLCGMTFSVGGLEIDNPCVYISDEDFSFAINSKNVPTTIIKSYETDKVAEYSLEQKDLYNFDSIEVSYFLLWLSNYKEYEYFPPHCYSRFLDGVFHRALVERKDQLHILNKVIDIVSCSKSMELNVKLLRFVFSVLTDCGYEISYEARIDICNKLENLYTFNFYYLKSGWDWDPVSWYLNFGMENHIPKRLLTYQKMASAEIKASNRDIILAKAFTRCLSMLNGKEIKLGSPILLNSYTERYVKNYHNEIYTFKTRNWTITGIDDETEDQSLFDAISEYFYSDWHHVELVDPVRENSLIELWLAMPPEYQKQIAELFRVEIAPYVDKEITVRALFCIFKKTYPDATNNIRAIGNYYLKYIQRCIGYLGYSIALSIPIENVKLETPIWIVNENKAEQKRKELINKSEGPIFNVNKKRRIVGVSPRVYALETVRIPSEIGDVRIKEIGPEVFANDKNMKQLIIDEGVTVIRKLAFNHCDNLVLVELPDSLTEIENGAFGSCKSLTQLTFPKNVKGIGDSVFYACSSLEKVEFDEKAESVGNQMFCNCSSLKEIIFPPLIKSIPFMFFYSCKSLETIYIPIHIEKIEPSAFAGCENLKTVGFGNEKCDICNSVFEYCSSLTNISLPTEIEDIENNTFNNCTGLKAIEIPAGVRHIGNFAFSNCEKLESVVFHNEECFFDDFVFADCVSLKSIRLPKASHGKLSSIFQGCKNLKRIVASRTMEKGDWFSNLVNSDVEIQFYD